MACKFTVDDDTGATASGYLVKQLSMNRFVVSGGTNTRQVTLSQNADEVSDLTT